MHGNQYGSRKATLIQRLHNARVLLKAGIFSQARIFLEWYREDYAKAPASTRRRWRCGQ